MVSLVPGDVHEACIVGVTFHDLLLGDPEPILVLKAAIGQFEDLLGTLATQGALAVVLDADGRSQILEGDVLRTWHILFGIKWLASSSNSPPSSAFTKAAPHPNSKLRKRSLSFSTR